MGNSFETVLGPVSWQISNEGIDLTMIGRKTSTRWSEITAAGLAESAMSLARTPTSPTLFSELSKYLPGLGKLTQINENLAQNYRTLVLARGLAHSRAIRIPIPIQTEEARKLVSEVQQHLSARWMGEVALGKSYSGFGIRRPWWTVPVSILFVLVLGFILLLACAGFAALDAILQGEKIAIPLVAWIGMAL